MLVTGNTFGYTGRKKHVTGRGFVDSAASIFRNIGSYIGTNKDLIAKPLLSAVGSLGALGLTSGVPALINHIMSKKNSKQQTPNIPDDPKYKEILESLATSSSAASAAAVQSTPVTNLIGSGSGVKRGSGIKQLGN
jgi:hypothetical protein